MNQLLAIEVAPFVIADGVSVDALMEASDRLEQDFLSKAEGYIGRILVRKDTRAWADVVFWKSGEHAARAMAAVSSSAACRSYFECMKEADHDDPQDGVTLFQAFKSYGAVNFQATRKQ